MEALSKVVSIILAAVLISLFPLQYMLEHELLLSCEYSENETKQLVSEIREKGFLDKGTYEEFLNKLSTTGLRYDIELEHAVPKEGADTVSTGNLPGVLVVSSSITSLQKIEDMGSKAVFSIPSDDNTAEEEGIMLFSTHTHTDDCYAGHRHGESGCEYSGDLNRKVIICRSSYTQGSYCYQFYTIGCATCGNNLLTFYQELYTDNCNWYRMGAAIQYWAYDSHGNVTITGYQIPSEYYFDAAPQISRGVYNSFVGQLDWLIRSQGCDQVGNTSTSVPLTLSASSLRIPIYNYPQGRLDYPTAYLPWKGCGYCGVYGQNYSCGLTEDTTSICDRVVTSIVATAPSQTVNKGGSIVTTATATYLDGHTDTVDCTSNFAPDKTGTQMVTLTYSGLVGNTKTTGTRTCTTSVKVIENYVPASLTVIPSSYTVYSGTEPMYAVTVTYEGGGTKTLTGLQYTKTGWTAGTGIKKVIFSYTENNKSVTASINITVKPNLTSIIVNPAEQFIERYTDPVFAVTAKYENNTTAIITGFMVTGINKNIIGKQDATIRYTENGITKTAAVKVTVTPIIKTCPVCGTDYYLDNDDFDQGCPVCHSTVVAIVVAQDYVDVHKNEALPILVTAFFADGKTALITDWISDYSPQQTGFQLVTVSYMGKTDQVRVNVLSINKCPICDTEYALNEDGSDPGCPICADNLVSISASPDSQTVDQGGAISLTVTAIYLDGHSTDVTGWASDFDSGKTGLQNVTVIYRSKSCTVSVTVISEYGTICNICGTTYNFMDNPFGCPICANTLVNISALLTNGGTRTPYGYPLDLYVVLTYRDGHKVQASGGWTDNFDSLTLGAQTVKVSYYDVYGNIVNCSLTVEVVDRGEGVICGNGHLYYPDESGEGCPYCALINGIDTQGLYNCTYTDDILDKLYTDGIYRFQKGDYVTVKVTVNTKGSIYSFNLFGRKEDKTLITSGGEI